MRETRFTQTYKMFHITVLTKLHYNFLVFDKNYIQYIQLNNNSILHNKHYHIYQNIIITSLKHECAIDLLPFFYQLLCLFHLMLNILQFIKLFKNKRQFSILCIVHKMLNNNYQCMNNVPINIIHV